MAQAAPFYEHLKLDNVKIAKLIKGNFLTRRDPVGSNPAF